MRLMMFKNTVLLFVLIAISCGSGTTYEDAGRTKLEARSTKQKIESSKDNDLQTKTIIVGANQTELYLPLLKGKKVGIVGNQSSVIFKAIGASQKEPRNYNYVHLVDSLTALKVDIKKVFAPEHGFRGTADAGEVIKDGVDSKTGIPVISLYSANKKPKLEQIKETAKYEQDVKTGVSVIDIMVFDLQDVGARFYTYISTLHYVMEACAEANIPLIILDRPNPNGAYVDGPVLEMEHTSFVGMHPIPVVHGMTIGEYAQMINGEKWLKNGVQCQLTVIPVKNYTHQTSYSLPIKPSPNLPNDTAINLYPSLCFFEGTNVSVGRGTSKQFQIYGSPLMYKDFYSFKFIPEPNEGAKTPLHQGKLCYGKDLSASKPLNAIDLKWLIEAYNHSIEKKIFFNDFFTKLAGTKQLRQQIEQGMNEQDIKATWQKDLNSFKTLRKKYLIYN
jgi:uncharacterized protein YbbC (DUF1343 family)